MAGRHGGDSLSRTGIAHEPERLGRAPLHQRRRVAQGGPQGLDGRRMADEPHREGRHLPHVGIAVAGEHGRQRRDALRQPDPPCRLGSAAAHPSIGIDEEREQVGRGRRRRQDLLRAAPFRRSRFGRRRRRRGTEDPLVFQPEHPGQLLFECYRRGLRRAGLAHGRARGQQRQPDGQS